jgi:hypothetical protein
MAINYTRPKDSKLLLSLERVNDHPELFMKRLEACIEAIKQRETLAVQSGDTWGIPADKFDMADFFDMTKEEPMLYDLWVKKCIIPPYILNFLKLSMPM